MPFTDARPVGNQLYGFPINYLYNHLRVISSVLSMVSITTLGTLLTIAEMLYQANVFLNVQYRPRLQSRK